MTSSPWWAPDVYADRRQFLMARNRVSAAVRAWFGANDFMEAETAILQVSPGNEAHLHAFSTRLVTPDVRDHVFYLHTSPEFAAKKLIAAGERRLFVAEPVLPGDEIYSVSEVTEVRRSRSKPDRGIVTLRVQTRNQRDEVVLEGTDVIMVGARSDA